ncbi:hypothetical protein [Pseudoteredinibacter isoporae]|uniref:Uncharacterized protein n=1 Tax=Pseudoteredinibacter isoporae TaxID=570281 RepID=A0A7X0MZ66_9GAMM|nr:hypothetical protein [Pseudoteredinibacter isoporae]MBB6523834.1 hypothetical protein [Pseudoteredinibacter isoporae]NHO89354.1 hypothetical protein [Pseudoteredinibacter isoporae]NIB22461.1 hypothetical protein [Pseudoteredinibacter isoporae]
MNLIVNFEIDSTLVGYIASYNSIVDKVNGALSGKLYSKNVHNIILTLQCIVVPEGFEHFLVRQKPKWVGSHIMILGGSQKELRNCMFMRDYLSSDMVLDLSKQELTISTRNLVQEIANIIAQSKFPDSAMSFNVDDLVEDIKAVVD